MDEVIKSIYEWVSHQGVGTIMILFALVWTYRRSKSDAETAATALKDAWTHAEIERKARWDDVTETIKGLRSRIEECEKDRRRMWEGMFKLGLRAKPPEDAEE